MLDGQHEKDWFVRPCTMIGQDNRPTDMVGGIAVSVLAYEV